MDEHGLLEEHWMTVSAYRGAVGYISFFNGEASYTYQKQSFIKIFGIDLYLRDSECWEQIWII